MFIFFISLRNPYLAVKSVGYFFQFLFKRRAYFEYIDKRRDLLNEAYALRLIASDKMGPFSHTGPLTTWLESNSIALPGNSPCTAARVVIFGASCSGQSHLRITNYMSCLQWSTK